MSDHKKNCVEAEKAADISDGGCGVCERLGFPLFLVRKSVIKRQLNGINWSSNIPSLGDREPKEELQAHEYVLRTLRTGYVYVLLEPKEGGEKEFLGYEVTPDGAFRYRSIKLMRETDIKPLPESCIKDDHTLPSLFINVDMSIYKETIWIAYSRRAWSENVRLKYTAENADLRRFTEVIINNDSKSEPSKLSPDRSFDFDKLLNGEIKLLEFENETLEGKFDSAHHFNSLGKRGTKDKLNNIAAGLAKKNNCKVGVVLVEDTFGIAEELNKQRLINCEPLVMPAWEQAKLMEDNIQHSFKDYAENTDAMGNNNKVQSAIDSYMNRVLDGKLPLKELNEELFKVFQNSPNKPLKLKSDQVPDYFKKELVYQRKIMSCINSYKAGLQDYFDEKFTDPQYRNFYFTTGDSRGDYLNQQEEARLLKEGWEKVELSPEDKDKTTGLRPRTRLVLTPEKAAENGFKKEWEKVKKRLSENKIETFEKKNKQALESLLSEIKHHNYDYLMYVTWLFGNQSQPSTEAINVERYNSVEFWLIECESDGLDAHKGYIDDAIAMLRGNITLAKLPEQYAIWDSLMRNNKTFYFHVLSGGEKSLWSWLLQERIDDSEKALEEIGNITKAVDTASKVADIPYQNKTLFVAAFEELVGWSVAGIANGPESAKRINSALMKGHFEESLKVLSNIEARRFTFNARIRDLPEIYRVVMSSFDEKSVLIKSGGKSIEVKNTGGNWEIQGNHSRNTLNNKIKIEMVLVAEDFASMQRLEQFLTARKNSGGGTVHSSSLQKASEINGAQMRPAVALATDLTADELLSAIKQARRRVAISEGKAAVINGIMVLLQMLSFYENKKLLQTQLPKEQHDKIVASMAKTLLTSGIMISQIGAQSVKMVGLMRQGGIFSQMIPGASSFIKGTGVILAGVAILDGVMDICSGFRMMARGDVGDGRLITIGGILGGLSGIILLYFAIYAATIPVLGLLLSIGLALLGAILVVIGSESNNWSPIELWFNRCLFGNQEHTEKGNPYQLTEADMGKSINDYFACISGSYLFVVNNMSEKKLVNAIYPEVPWYARISDPASGFDNPVAQDAISREFYGSLYLLAGLSQYSEKSTFEGEVIIECHQGAPIRLKIEKASDRINFIPTVNISADSKLLLVKEASDAEKHTYGVSEKNKSAGIFTIEQKIGEISGLKQLYCFLNYWAEGKDINSVPMRLEYKQ